MPRFSSNIANVTLTVIMSDQAEISIIGFEIKTTIPQKNIVKEKNWFKVCNKDTKLQNSVYFKPFSRDSIVDFEQINVLWVYDGH